ERTQATGVDAFELNFSCPHGLPERKMGAAMGQDCAIMEEVCRWVVGASKIPVWAKLTPNVTHIQDGCEAALKAGCHGVSAINTIADFKGPRLQHVPTPTCLGEAQAEAKAAANARDKSVVTKDRGWQGDDLTTRSDALARG